MGAVDRLGFHGRVPPRVVQDHVAGGGEVQSRAGGAQAQQEYARIGIVLEGLHHGLAFFGLTRENVRPNLALAALGLQEFEHLHKLAEDENLVSLAQQRIEQLEQRFGFSGRRIAAHQGGMATNLAQTRKRRQHMDFAFGDAFFSHRLHNLVPAAAQLGKIQFALLFAEFAVPALFDAFGKIFGHLLFKAAHHHGPQFGREAAAGDAGRHRVRGNRRLVRLQEVVLRTEVARLDEVHNAPQVQEPVLQRCSR